MPPNLSFYQHLYQAIILLCKALLVYLFDVRRPWCVCRILLSHLVTEFTMFWSAGLLRFLHLIGCQKSELLPMKRVEDFRYLTLFGILFVIIVLWPWLTAAWKFWPTEEAKTTATASHQCCPHCTLPYERPNADDANMRLPVVLACCQQVLCNICIKDIDDRDVYRCPFCRQPKSGDERIGFGIIRRQNHHSSTSPDCFLDYDPSTCDICEGDYSTAASISRLPVILPCCKTVVCNGCSRIMAKSGFRFCAYCTKHMKNEQGIIVTRLLE